MSTPLFTFKEYLHYLIRAQNAHGLHSPFIYQLYNEVILQRDRIVEEKLLKIRKAFFRTSENISYTDPKTGEYHTIKAGRLAMKTSSSHRFSWFLINLINFSNYRSVLEAGTSIGLNSCYLTYSQANTITSIEGAKEIAHVAGLNLEKHGAKPVALVVGDIHDVFEKSLNQYQPQLVFLDADHRSTSIDFYMSAIAKVQTVKCIVIHDIYWSADMKRAWQKIVQDSKYNLTIDIFYAGLVFVNYPMEKQHFSLKF